MRPDSVICGSMTHLLLDLTRSDAETREPPLSDAAAVGGVRLLPPPCERARPDPARAEPETARQPRSPHARRASDLEGPAVGHNAADRYRNHRARTGPA